MRLSFTTQAEETWLDAARRYARPYGLTDEVAQYYHEAVIAGEEPHEAAFSALEEFDLLDVETSDVSPMLLS